MKRLRVLDLFSGVGGFSMAFDRPEFEIVAHCEKDPFCQASLSAHWPQAITFSNIEKLTFKNNELYMTKPLYWEDIRTSSGLIDIVVGGFPCTDVSIAGKRKGFRDEDTKKKTRSGLWSEYARIIKETSPRWVVIENVPGLYSKGLARVLKDLNAIGYDAEWHPISARSIGAPHFRERIWITAYPNRNAVRNQPGRCSGTNREGLAFPGDSDQERRTHSAYCDDFRFWPSFTTEEEASRWWTEATAEFRHWWKTPPKFVRVDDGIPRRLDLLRKERVKQMGNSLVPFIAALHAERIVFHEFGGAQ